MFRLKSIIANGGGICNYFVKFAGAGAAERCSFQLPSGERVRWESSVKLSRAPGGRRANLKWEDVEAGACLEPPWFNRKHGQTIRAGQRGNVGRTVPRQYFHYSGRLLRCRGNSRREASCAAAGMVVHVAQRA